ncbi:MAG: Mur ligase family protein [Cyanobacteriota bacterium]
MICEDLQEQPTNAIPEFREGLETLPIINMLSPPGSHTRIPILAVTGTNGKTTHLIAHILKGIGKWVGFTTTNGVYIQNHHIQNHQIAKGDMTSPYSARLVLQNPTVKVAVLETAREEHFAGGAGVPGREYQGSAECYSRSPGHW